jgi:hypothetical protein
VSFRPAEPVWLLAARAQPAPAATDVRLVAAVVLEIVALLRQVLAEAGVRFVVVVVVVDPPVARARQALASAAAPAAAWVAVLPLAARA